MPKLPVLSGQAVRRVLESHEFQLVRQRGSHMVMQWADEGGGTTTVPVPDHAELRTGNPALDHPAERSGRGGVSKVTTGA